MSMPLGRQETDFRNAIILEASRRRVAILWAQNAGKAFLKGGGVIHLGDEGMSDIIGCESMSGRSILVCFEVKSPDRVTTAAQFAFLKAMGENGAVALLYRYQEAFDWDQNVNTAVDKLVSEIEEVDRAHREALQ